MKTLKTTFMVLSMSSVLAACGPYDGSPAYEEMLARTAAAQFVGVWNYVSLDARFTCSDGRTGTDTTVSGTETFRHGSWAGQLFTVDSDHCASECRASGISATCQPAYSTCGGITFLVLDDVFTFFGDRLSEKSTFRKVLEDGTTCDVKWMAWLAPAK